MIAATKNSIAPRDLWPLPNEWQWLSLNEVAPRDSGTAQPSDKPSQVFTYLGLEHIERGQWNKAKYQSVKGQEIKSSCVVFDDSHVLYGKLRPYLNKVVVPDRQGFGSTEWVTFRPDQARLERSYLAWFLRSPSFVAYASRNVTGSRMPRVRMDVILEAPVPIPFPSHPKRSLDIQQRIVARIEALLAEVRSSRELLDEMKQDAKLVMEYALSQVFGKIRSGFDVVDVPPNQMKKIDDVVSVERGKFLHRPRNDPKFFGGAMPWIQIQDLSKGSNKYITEYVKTLNEQGVATSKVFPKGTLVLSISGTIGNLGILDFDACFPDSLVGITPYDVDSGFLYWQLLFVKKHLESIAPAAAQRNINLKILKKINLWIPSSNDQKMVSHYLDSIQNGVDKMLKLMNQDAKNLDLFEQSILERAFRGKL